MPWSGRSAGLRSRIMRAHRGRLPGGRLAGITEVSGSQQGHAFCASTRPVQSGCSNVRQVSSAAPPRYPAGIGPANRARLEELNRGTSGPFTVREAAALLGCDADDTARLLGYLARRGWLTRVRRGLYLTVPLNARRSGEWVEDSWIIASRVFAPCYIGGWSACEYWDFTEQLFRTTLVITGTKFRQSTHELQGLSFEVTTRKPELLFGTRPVWRGQTRVDVSDPSRTIVDVLDEPRLGGGIRHCSTVLHEYLRSEHRDDEQLVEYGDRLGNRTIFKRLGYLLEIRNDSQNVGRLSARCRERVSTGYTTLDPTNTAKGRLVRRWGLRVNVSLAKNDGDD